MPFTKNTDNTPKKKKTNWPMMIAILFGFTFSLGMIIFASNFQDMAESSKCSTAMITWFEKLRDEPERVTVPEPQLSKIKKFKTPKRQDGAGVWDYLKFGMKISFKAKELLPNLVKTCEEYREVYLEKCPVVLRGVELPNEKGAMRSFEGVLFDFVESREGQGPTDLEAVKVQDLEEYMTSNERSICDIK